jgi:hypothetical protein
MGGVGSSYLPTSGDVHAGVNAFLVVAEIRVVVQKLARPFGWHAEPNLGDPMPGVRKLVLSVPRLLPRSALLL